MNQRNPSSQQQAGAYCTTSVVELNFEHLHKKKEKNSPKTGLYLHCYFEESIKNPGSMSSISWQRSK